MLSGFKNFCSGTTNVDAAPVSAHGAGGILWFEIPLSAPGVRVESSSWASAGLDDTATGRVSFLEVVLDSASPLGGAGWYLERTGFWSGAVGPAVCWAGGAQALIDIALNHVNDDVHSRAQCGALIERMCMEMLDRFGRVTGTEALTFDAMAPYIRQWHGERDLEQV